jgi:hypothetical protein
MRPTSRQTDLIEFEIEWLGYDGKPIATGSVKKHDLTEAIRYAGRQLADPGSNPRSEGPGRRKAAAEAHGVFVRPKR